MPKQCVVALLLFICVLFGSSRSGVAQNESLLIGSGDLVQVDVMDTPEMEQQVRVTDAGTIDLAYIGSVHVAGMPPSAAAAEIRSQLMGKHVMRDPQVVMRVVEYSTQNVSVLGEVHAPGSYPLTTPQSILKVLALAGGLSDEADRHISIKKMGQSKETVYYLSNESSQALADVVTVSPGDTVLVPRAPRVYIAGDVSRPGSYAIATNNSELTVLQALTAAGSPNKTAVKHVRLIRPNPGGEPTEIPVNLAQIEKGKEPDVTLQPNDVLYIPFSWTKNLAIGSASIVAATTSGALYVVR